MKDIFNLPSIEENIFVFNASVGAEMWQMWQKPRNATFAMFYLLGGGAGGGGGQSGKGIGRNGGGGGGSGGISMLMIPLILLPDTLYIKVGLGGEGGEAGVNGSNGNGTVISTQPEFASASNVVLIAFGGTGGSAAGTAGAGASVYTLASGFLTVWGVGNFFAGTNGSTGGNTAGGNAGNITATFPMCGGTGGGGASSGGINGNGGSIGANEVLPGIAGGSGGATNDGQSGLLRTNISNNTSSRSPLFFNGGAGGGAFASGTGGNGGNGSVACGGGGGGAGVTGGRGGKGGDGIVIITCF